MPHGVGFDIRDHNWRFCLGLARLLGKLFQNAKPAHSRGKLLFSLLPGCLSGLTLLALRMKSPIIYFPLFARFGVNVRLGFRLWGSGRRFFLRFWGWRGFRL